MIEQVTSEHHLKVLVYHGGDKQSAEELKECDVVITSYATLSQGLEAKGPLSRFAYPPTTSPGIHVYLAFRGLLFAPTLTARISPYQF